MAALSSGADAVYAGGGAFGARAYARNFTDEELLRAIDTAHLYGKKLYLTVNTLCKEREFSELYDFLTPFYKAGLDAVIVQDVGIVSLIRECFPSMPIHASTQMTITGIPGALFARSLGMDRIVPARELSLKELCAIRKETGLELETFIHGAMCYSYSGQCLFSSFLGGRSGNRGRCAQPCRLEYRAFCDGRQISKKEEPYLLSMKDLCTIEILPKLIEAGIASFKIEGRMKSPGYTAFVTSMYRKYMDLYYEKGAEGYRVDKADIVSLKQRYVRTDIQTGYYDVRNSRKLITLKQPSYEGSKSEADTIPAMSAIELTGEARFYTGEEITLTLRAGDISFTAKGEVCQKAVNRPMDRAAIEKQLLKTGGSEFSIKNLDIDMADDIFVPVAQLNALRREALEGIKEALISGHTRGDETKPSYDAGKEDENSGAGSMKCSVLTETLPQLKALRPYFSKISRIYVDYSLFMRDAKAVRKCLEGFESEVFMALPYIVREGDVGRISLPEYVCGVLCRSYEELEYFAGSDLICVADSGVYSFNKRACDLLLEKGAHELTLPLELNIHEMRERGHAGISELVFYGRVPMMISAGCILKTLDMCGRQHEELYLTDRKNSRMPVINDCGFCSNRILNSVPTYLIGERKAIASLSPGHLRLHFTTESGDECTSVLDEFFGGAVSTDRPYTAGHFRKSVQ